MIYKVTHCVTQSLYNQEEHLEMVNQLNKKLC